MSRIAIIVLSALWVFSLPVSAADSEAQKKAQDVFDSLYGADVKRVRATKDAADDTALAAKLLDAARAAAAQPEFLVVLCAGACELGAADPAGYETALAAYDLAMEKAPAAAGACQDALVTMRQRQYDTARGDAKTQAGDTLIDALAAAADTRLRGGDAEGAQAHLLKAMAVARQAKSQKAEAIEARVKALAARQKSAAEVERLKRQVAADPNAKTRDQLVRLLVVDLDNPAEAAKYIDESSDATFRKFVPAAAKPVADAPEMACLELMDWYVTLAATAGPAGKAAMYARAILYGERFLELHTAKDLERTRAELSVKKARDAAAGAGKDPAAGQWIDLLKIIDPVKDASKGKWERTKGGLTTTSTNYRSSMIEAPLAISGSYELEARFVRVSGADVVVGLPVGAGACTFIMAGCWGEVSGFELINGRSITQNETRVNPGRLENNHLYTLLLQVEIAGDKAAMTAVLDGKPYTKWSGPQQALTVAPSHWTMANPKCIGLGCVNSQVVFQSVRLKMLSGKAVPTRPLGR
jgi:hypothetical protein